MAQYKVPQDVEADDKLLGPFSFRQFVYLLIAGGLIALAVGLFQLFPLLAILPLPPILLFGALALPLRKDQPMETYLAALVSYYLKPRKRIWTPGQRESTIQITAPKIVETTRARDITGEEATHRLSFLADIVDTGGYAIKGAGTNPMREDLIAEANATMDMFENGRYSGLQDAIAKDENERHEEIISEMRQAIEQSEMISGEHATIRKGFDKPELNSPVVIMPELAKEERESVDEKKEEKTSQKIINHSIMELANNSDFSVATIEKEAKRIKERDEGEVFILLH